MAFCSNCDNENKETLNYTYYGEYAEEDFFCRECNQREKVYYDNKIKLNEIYNEYPKKPQTNQET
tara:strand:+ start:60 stop:254 length:195 start_codon:yes stop_codon:yes gene_type:complete